MRVVNIRKERCTVYVGRPSKLGNPFIIGHHGDREKVIRLFRRYARWYLMSDIAMLDYEDVLGCYCHPQKCHADVIMDLWATTRLLWHPESDSTLSPINYAEYEALISLAGVIEV